MTDVANTPALDVAHIENVEAELNAFVERRAKAASKAEAEEMMWKASVRRHNEKIRRKNRAAWFSYFCGQAQAHAAIAADYERRAEELCEEGAR